MSEAKMSEMISTNLQNANDCLDEIFKEMSELTKSLELTQDQLDEELNHIKKNIKILVTSIKGSKMIFWIQIMYPQNWKIDQGGIFCV